MSLKKAIRARFFGLYLGEGYLAARRRLVELERRLGGRRHVVSAFVQLDDPYSYLLCHYLPEFAAHYDVELDVYLAQALGDEFTPQPAMLAEYAINDCRLVTRELGLPFLDKGTTPVVERRRALLDTLAVDRDAEHRLDRVRRALGAYWRGDSEGVDRLLGRSPGDAPSSELVARNQSLLRRLGHYNCATLHYGGEWYWGIDRLHYLTARLDALGRNLSGKPNPALASIRQAMQLKLPGAVPGRAQTLPPLELFYSFRSPYAYLSLQSAFRIADAFGMELQVKPVLPMVMRGLPVPQQKLRYIVLDAAREARRLGVPFGKLADSAGTGAERCIATFYYAQQEHRVREFLLAAGNAIWNEGTDVATDRGLRKVTERVGLFWPEVKAAIADDAWRSRCAANRDAMTEAGVWGVPVYKVGPLVLWGQDRDWLVARQIEDLCHGGEGIMI